MLTHVGRSGILYSRNTARFVEHRASSNEAVTMLAHLALSDGGDDDPLILRSACLLSGGTTEAVQRAPFVQTARTPYVRVAR